VENVFFVIKLEIVSYFLITIRCQQMAVRCAAGLQVEFLKCKSFAGLWIIHNSFDFLFTFVAVSFLLCFLSGLDLALQSFFQVTWELESLHLWSFFRINLSLIGGLLTSNISDSPKFVGSPSSSVSFLCDQEELVSESISFVFFTRIIQSSATLTPRALIP